MAIAKQEEIENDNLDGKNEADLSKSTKDHARKV
jgi:hypothetical protein